MKWLVAINAGWRVYKEIRKAQAKAAAEKRAWKYEHEAQVLYAKLQATAAGDPEPKGN